MCDGLCPSCFGEAWYDDYNSCQCTECSLFFGADELIPLPPPVTEDDWEFIFFNEPSPEEFELMEQEADVLLQSLIGD